MALFSNGYESPKVSPGLDMRHGFIKQIQKHQERRLHSDTLVEINRNEVSKVACKTPKAQSYELPGRGKQLFSLDFSPSPPTKKTPDSNSSSSCSLGGDIDLTLEEVDLGNYVAEAQPYIQNALENPSSISGRQLQNVAEVIVNRAWEDKGYYKIAAKMCKVIFKKEAEISKDDIIPSNNFRNGLTTTCSMLMKDNEEFRKHSIEGFIAFIHFLSKTYSYLKVAGRGLQSLVWLLYDGLHVLCSPECLANFELVELLHSTLHDVGSSLEKEHSEKMVELICKIRDILLDQDTDDFSRGILLEILELRASKWHLPLEVSTYYMEYNGAEV